MLQKRFFRYRMPSIHYLKWTSKRNLFDILKISRTEIRHSNMLAWLLNPSENHDLGDSVPCGFIQYYVTNYRAVDTFFQHFSLIAIVLL